MFDPGCHTPFSGAGPTATLIGDGNVSSLHARQVRDRSASVSVVAALGDALAQGVIGSDHVDALSRAVKAVGEPSRALLLDRADELALRATEMPADAYATWVNTMARMLEVDEGESRLAAQKRANPLRWWTNATTGMLCVNDELDPESGSRFVVGLRDGVDTLAAAGAERSEHTQATALVDLVTRGRVRGPANVVNELGSG